MDLPAILTSCPALPTMTTVACAP